MGAGLRVRCPSCHRRERWDGEAREVLLEGGLRRPEAARERAAFDVLAASIRGALPPVVGVCTCGMPLVAEGADPRPISVDLGALGALVADGPRLTLDGAPVAVDALEQRVHATWAAALPPDASLLMRVLHGGAVTMMLFPIGAWFVAVFIVITFYVTWATGSGPSVGPQ